MEDLSKFAPTHPEFCDPKTIRVPGYLQVPSLEGARSFDLTSENLSTFRVEAAKKRPAWPAMLRVGAKAGPSSVGSAPVRAGGGSSIREAGLRALRKENIR